ncbi:MAG: ribosomal protein [Pseudomonadota bacterium]|jgi:large subunit ribosomal protein L21
MFAIIKTGGKQFTVREGDRLRIEKLDGEIGATVEFEALMVSDGAEVTKIGAPTVAGAKVVAEVIDQGRLGKVYIIKFRRRKHYRKQQGHRQYFTAIKINQIQLG